MDSETVTTPFIRPFTLDEVDSTSSYIKRLIADSDPRLHEGLAVAAVAQTAGRGQRGNSWEADPGMNITISVLLKPSNVAPAGQFAISEAVALAVAATVDRFLPEGMSSEVKWPNDIYVGTRKISGILIENTLCGSEILWCVCGIGLNVNQPEFRSDAPNPVSLRQLHGSSLDRDEVEWELYRQIELFNREYIHHLPKTAAALHSRYMEKLWRREGTHRWCSVSDGEEFTAAIHSIASSGHMNLILPDSTLRTYAFKEVAYI